MTNEQSAIQNPTTDEILEALLSTGFMLEYHTAQLLRKHDFYVDMNSAFPDPESGKSREIDIVAEIMDDNIGVGCDINIALELIIECKNNSNPLLLIGEDDLGASRSYHSDIDIVSFDPLNTFKFSGDSLPSIQGRLGLNSIGVPGDRTFAGSQLLRMDRSKGKWQANNSSLYDSFLYPLAKSWKYRKGQWSSEHEDVGHGDDEFQEWEYPIFRYILPVIVTAGPVFKVDMTSGTPEITEVDWARLNGARSASKG